MKRRALRRRYGHATRPSSRDPAIAWNTRDPARGGEANYRGHIIRVSDFGGWAAEILSKSGGLQDIARGVSFDDVVAKAKRIVDAMRGD